MMKRKEDNEKEDKQGGRRKNQSTNYRGDQRMEGVICGGQLTKTLQAAEDKFSRVNNMPCRDGRHKADLSTVEEKPMGRRALWT